MTNLTPAQKRLVKEVSAIAPCRFPLSVERNGFRVADALIAQGVLIDVTTRADFTRWVKLAA